MYVWDVNSRSLQYKLPGHMGSVNEVQFYPESKEPISKFISTVTSTVTQKTFSPKHINSFVFNES